MRWATGWCSTRSTCWIIRITCPSWTRNTFRWFTVSRSVLQTNKSKQINKIIKQSQIKQNKTIEEKKYLWTINTDFVVTNATLTAQIISININLSLVGSFEVCMIRITKLTGQRSGIKELTGRANLHLFDLFREKSRSRWRNKQKKQKPHFEFTEKHSSPPTNTRKKKRKMKWLFLLSIGAILASIVYQIIVSSSSRVVRLVPSQGIIVISSSSGGGREMALKLADVGFHVIVGVSTSKEKSSYKYSTSKGLKSSELSFIESTEEKIHWTGVDPMLLDLSEPGQIAQLHYKLQSLTMKHERNVVGVVFIKDDQSSKKSDSIDIDRNYLHDTYQDQLQGTLRLYQVNSTSISLYFNILFDCWSLEITGVGSFLQFLCG